MLIIVPCESVLRWWLSVVLPYDASLSRFESIFVPFRWFNLLFLVIIPDSSLLFLTAHYCARVWANWWINKSWMKSHTWVNKRSTNMLWLMTMCTDYSVYASFIIIIAGSYYCFYIYLYNIKKAIHHSFTIPIWLTHIDTILVIINFCVLLSQVVANSSLLINLKNGGFLVLLLIMPYWSAHWSSLLTHHWAGTMCLGSRLHIGWWLVQCCKLLIDYCWLLIALPILTIKQLIMVTRDQISASYPRVLA